MAQSIAEKIAAVHQQISALPEKSIWDWIDEKCGVNTDVDRDALEGKENALKNYQRLLGKVGLHPDGAASEKEELHGGAISSKRRAGGGGNFAMFNTKHKVVDPAVTELRRQTAILTRIASSLAPGTPSDHKKRPALGT